MTEITWAPQDFGNAHPVDGGGGSDWSFGVFNDPTNEFFLCIRHYNGGKYGVWEVRPTGVTTQSIINLADEGYPDDYAWYPCQVIWLSATRVLVVAGAAQNPAYLFVIEKQGASWVMVSNYLTLWNNAEDFATFGEQFTAVLQNYGVMLDGSGGFYVVTVGEGFITGPSDRQNLFLRRHVTLTGNTLAVTTLWEQIGTGLIPYSEWLAGRPIIAGSILSGNDLWLMTRANGYASNGIDEGVWLHKVSGTTVTIEKMSVLWAGSGFLLRETVGWRLGMDDGVPLVVVGYYLDPNDLQPITVATAGQGPLDGTKVDPLWNFNYDRMGQVTQQYAPDGAVVVVGPELVAYTAAGEQVLATFTEIPEQVNSKYDFMVAFTLESHHMVVVSSPTNSYVLEVLWVPRTAAPVVVVGTAVVRGRRGFFDHV